MAVTSLTVCMLFITQVSWRDYQNPSRCHFSTTFLSPQLYPNRFRIMTNYYFLLGMPLFLLPSSASTPPFIYEPHIQPLLMPKPSQSLLPNLFTKLSHLSCSFAHFLFWPTSWIMPPLTLGYKIILNKTQWNTWFLTQPPLCSWSSAHRGLTSALQSGNQQQGHWKSS